jgi:hypothetical protein
VEVDWISTEPAPTGREPFGHVDLTYEEFGANERGDRSAMTRCHVAETFTRTWALHVAMLYFTSTAVSKCYDCTSKSFLKKIEIYVHHFE